MPQVLLDTDSFAGVDNDALSTYNAKWSNPDGTNYNECQIKGTPGVSGSLGLDQNTGQAWTNDQWCELKVDGTTLADQFFQILLRVQAGTFSGYAIGSNPGQIGNQTYRIERFDSNTRVELASDAATLALNDVVNAQIVGTVIILFVNGAPLITYDTVGDATTYASGNVGIRLHSTTNARLGGTWRAGSVSSAVKHHLMLLGVR